MPRRRKTLAGGNAQPVAVASGGPYGSRQALEQAQRAAPVAAGSPSPAPGAGTAPPQSPLDAAAAHPAPANVPLNAPTQSPNMPLTSGLDVGAGPGSDSLMGVGQQFSPLISAAAVLNAIPDDDHDPETAYLRALVNATLSNQSPG